MPTTKFIHQIDFDAAGNRLWDDQVKPIDTDLSHGPHFLLAWGAHRDTDLAAAARQLDMGKTARYFEERARHQETALVAMQPMCSRDYLDEECAEVCKSKPSNAPCQRFEGSR